MLLSNYHTHCHYCDGHQNLEDYIHMALELGFKAIGFSSHAPIEGVEWTMTQAGLRSYLSEVEALKQRFQGEIEIYKGLEIDFVPQGTNPGSAIYKPMNLDYCLGAFHVFPLEDSFFAVDGPEEEFEALLHRKFNGSMPAFSQAYYDQIGVMMDQGHFQILCHLDLIKKRNSNQRYFREDEPWYQNQIRKMLEKVKAWGGILEVNTGGISRGATKEIYPSPWIVNKAVKMGIPFCINSDAHWPEHLDFYFKESCKILKDAGAREHMALYEQRWQAFPI